MSIEQLEVVKPSENGCAVTILDQTQLPNRTDYLTLKTPREMWDAIKKLQVRGAPAIGVFTAYAIAALAKQSNEQEPAVFTQYVLDQAEYLNTSRPTAVNLSWACKRMSNVLRSNEGKSVEELKALLEKEALAIDEENKEMTEKIGAYGNELIKDGDGILTHCNAGYLACLGIGTATAPIYYGAEHGKTLHVYSDETRPLLQGARLTSYELHKAGIDVTSICDNMASLVMKEGKIQAVFVGCDRIAANGDFANKIGTSGVAILAKHYGIPFYTLGPSSTIDFNTEDGAHIKIEERDPDEIRSMWYAEPMVLNTIPCYNPAFDVTDHELLTAIVTERGIVYPPFRENLAKLFDQKEGK